MRPTLLALAILAVHASAASADPPRVRVWPDTEWATTQGTALVDASPSVIYGAVTDYAAWRSLFDDVTWVALKRGTRRDAVVEFKSRAMGHTVTVQFDNEENRVIRFRLVDGPPGARARGEFVLEPVGNRTLVRASLYMDVKGMAAWFVTDGRVTRMREAKLTNDLRDLARRWLARDAG